MRLAPGTPLALGLRFAGHGDPLPAGRVVLDRGLAQLEWSGAVLARGLPLSPLLYPPEPGLIAARGRAFDGLHGFLADSLPDAWGQRLMRRRLAQAGIDIATLSALDRLALVGSSGRGALVYQPATAPDDAIATLDLDLLAEGAARILADDPTPLEATLARLAAGSGGARPKIHVGFDETGTVAIGEHELDPRFAPWLVKFRAPADPADIGGIEFAYAQMAGAAGLMMSPCRLLPARRGPGYFATRRFDRPGGGARLHMLSLAGAIEAPKHMPASYDLLLRATRALTRHAGDVDLAFRRMVFNVLAHNRDDHTAQHAYLMDEHGDWRLAPAYDLTFSQGPGGEHYCDVAGEGRQPTRAGVMALGSRHRLSAQRVTAIIAEVEAGIANWPRFAAEAGLGKRTIAAIGKAHAAVRRGFHAA